MLMTIAEFALNQRVSKTSIYKKLNTIYKDCVVVKDGIKYIDTDKIKTTKSTDRKPPVVEQIAIKLDNNSDKQQEKAEKEQEKVETTGKAEENKEIEALKAEIESLKAQLEEAKSASKDKETRLLDMTEKVLKLTENAQILLARTQEQQQTIAEQQQRLLLVEAKPKRKGLFSWFKKEKPME